MNLPFPSFISAFCHLLKAPMDRIALNIKCKLWRTKNSFGIGMHAPVIEFQSVLWCTGRFRFDYQLASESLITHWWTANGYRFPIWVSNFQFSMCDSGCSFQRPSARGNVYFGCFYPAAQPISSLFFYSFVHELLMHRINTSDRSIHCQWLTWLNSLYRFEHPMGLAAVVDQYEDEPPLWNLQLWKSVCVPTFGILFLLYKLFQRVFHTTAPTDGPYLTGVQWIEWKSFREWLADWMRCTTRVYNTQVEIFHWDFLRVKSWKRVGSIRETRCISRTYDKSCFLCFCRPNVLTKDCARALH